MIIGIPSEIKNNESRVALTPSGSKELSKKGHEVYLQSNAGAGSGFPDKEYLNAGAKILSQASEIYEIAEMIMKVKEPIESEYALIKKGQLIFTLFSFCLIKAFDRCNDGKSICMPILRNGGNGR